MLIGEIMLNISTAGQTQQPPGALLRLAARGAKPGLTARKMGRDGVEHQQDKGLTTHHGDLMGQSGIYGDVSWFILYNEPAIIPPFHNSSAPRNHGKKVGDWKVIFGTTEWSFIGDVSCMTNICRSKS